MSNTIELNTMSGAKLQKSLSNEGHLRVNINGKIIAVKDLAEALSKMHFVNQEFYIFTDTTGKMHICIKSIHNDLHAIGYVEPGRLFDVISVDSWKCDDGWSVNNAHYTGVKVALSDTVTDRQLLKLLRSEGFLDDRRYVVNWINYGFCEINRPNGEQLYQLQLVRG